MRLPVNWDDFRLVQAIAETKSLSGAAERLSLNHSTVFRRLGALEAQIGLRLFERSRLGYATTAAGEEMVELAIRMANDVLDFERKIVGSDVKPTGELRITTNDAMVIALLPRPLAAFRAAYPDIRLDIIVANQALNLSRRDADVAVRATDDPQETLIGRRICAIAWAVYGTRGLIDHWKSHEHPAAPWVGYHETFNNVPAVRRLSQSVSADRIGYRTTTVLGQPEAVAAGIGFGYMPCFIGDRDRELIRCTPPDKEGGRALWILTHPDLKQSARVRAFMDFVGAELTRRRKDIEG